jgi:hypothetical protein
MNVMNVKNERNASNASNVEMRVRDFKFCARVETNVVCLPNNFGYFYTDVVVLLVHLI